MCYLYFFCLHCCLINIHIFDYPDSRLFGLFTEVPTSPDNRGSTVQKFSRVLEPLHWLHSSMPIFIAVYFSIAILNAAERFSGWTSLIDRKSTSKSWSIWKRPPRGFVNLYFLFSSLFYQQLQFDRAWARASAQVTLFLCSSLINREPTEVRRKTPSISAFYSEVGREPFLFSQL